MSRINYPADFIERTNLFYAIEKKHTEDGADSPLTDFLTQKEIDLAKNKTKTDSAVVSHKAFTKQSDASEDFKEKRDNFWKPVMSDFRMEAQHIKAFYKGNPKQLGDWALRVDGKSRIVFPEEFKAVSDMFLEFYKKYKELGDKSPLNKFLKANEIDIAQDKADTDEAQIAHKEMGKADKAAEKFRKQRDTDFDPVFKDIRDIGQFLKSLFAKNPKKLGDWGFTIDDSPLPKKPKPPTS